MTDMKTGTNDAVGKVSDQLIARRKSRNRTIPFSEIQQEYCVDLPEPDKGRSIDIRESMLIDDADDEQEHSLIDQLSIEFNQTASNQTEDNQDPANTLPVEEIRNEYSLIVENTDGLSEEMLATFDLDEKAPDEPPEEPSHRRRHLAIATTMLVALIAYLNIGHEELETENKMAISDAISEAGSTRYPVPASVQFASPGLKAYSHSGAIQEPGTPKQASVNQTSAIKPATHKSRVIKTAAVKRHQSSRKQHAPKSNSSTHPAHKRAPARHIRTTSTQKSGTTQAAKHHLKQNKSRQSTLASGNTNQKRIKWVWGVNLGSFPSPNDARHEISKLDRNGYPHELVTVRKGAHTYYRLRIPAVSDKKTATTIASHLNGKLKIRDVWVNRYRKAI